MADGVGLLLLACMTTEPCAGGLDNLDSDDAYMQLEKRETELAFSNQGPR